MSGNIFGELFKVATFGESHGPAMGCVIDGCPAGLELSVDDIRQELLRRRPGKGPASTGRNEADEPEILSGVFEGKTLGTPIAVMVRNTDSHSSDYDDLRNVYRPGHADFGWQAKFGVRDHRGGGRSSGRETLSRVAAGAVAKKFLAVKGITVQAWVSAIAGLKMPDPGDSEFSFNEIENNPFRVGGREAAEKALNAIETIKKEHDSAGGIISCLVRGVPSGLGEPVFGKLDARLSGAMFSIGAVKGIEIGAGFSAALMKGSQNNDVPLAADKATGNPVFATNNSGGMLGGISSGQDIEFKVAFKPAASIGKTQKAFTGDGAVVDCSIKGRHDVCIVPRALPVVEAMTALVLADLILLQRTVCPGCSL